MTPIRLLLVDDHLLFRQSLRRLLEAEATLDVVADVGTAAAALAILRQHPLDIVLLDFDLGPHHSGTLIETARQAGSSAKVLIVTAGMTAAESAMALRLGAAGIFLKHGAPSTLIDAIRVVTGGGSWIDPSVVEQLATLVTDGPLSPPPRSSLTEREQAVLQGVFEGLTNKEIGSRLGLSESSVKAALQQLFRKARVRTRGQLVRVALEGALVTARKAPS